MNISQVKESPQGKKKKVRVYEKQMKNYQVFLPYKKFKL